MPPTFVYLASQSPRRRQLLDQIVIKVFDDVDMRLDEGDVRSDSLDDSEKFLLGCHVYTHTQI